MNGYQPLPNRNYPKPPIGSSSITKECEHKFTYLGQRTEGGHSTSSIPKQVDVFYCEKCLEIKKISI